MNFKKHFFLFLIFGLSVLVLLFPRTSLAVITGSGCETNSTVIYRTECGESKTIGSCSRKCCDTECCEWDEEGNCTDTCCVDRCWDCSCPAQSWNEYQCDSPNCDGDIKIRTCTVSKKGSCPSGCGNDQCCVTCGEWKTCEECGSWQKPIRESCECTKAGQNKPKCKCSGGCIAAPTGLRYYDNPNYPTNPCNPEPGEGSTNIKLPVKLDWDDVEGWKGGWCSGSGYELADACGNMTTAASVSPYKQCCLAKEQACVETKSAEINWDELTACERRVTLYMIEDDCKWTHYQVECLHEYWESTPTEPEPSTDPTTCGTVDCPYPNLRYNPSEMVQHYEITITGDMRDADGNAISNYSANLDQSEFIPPNPCFFKSNRTYTWSVRACCGSGGCGPAATSAFTTNLAPEPVWPYDPDWAGPDRAEPNWKAPTVENPYPVRLEWCPVDEAKSYCLRMYKAGTPFIRMYGQGEPFCPVLFSALYCPAVVPPNKDFPIQSYFDFGLDVFTKETDYQWKVATCLNQEGQKCGLSCAEDKICYTFETLKSECGCCDFSQLWNFFGQVVLSIPELISPKDGEFVNFTHELKWAHVPGANSYRYEIKRDSSVIINKAIVEEYIPIKDLWDKGILTFNTQYSWHIQPCWDQEGKDCEEKDGEKAWSAEWSFTVSGAPPTELQVDATIIPVKLDWENVPGVLTYYYEVAKDSSFSDIVIPEDQRVLKGNISEVLVDYPYLVQNTNYYWRVKTCIDEKGEVCGNWSEPKDFKTFKLEKPTEPYPSDGSEFYTYERYLKWKEVPGARAYQYEVYEGVKIIPLTKVPAKSAYVDTPRELGVGEHAWRVKACLDENCQEAGEFSDDWHFNVVEAEPPGGQAGLVPCGRDVNFSDPYGIDETERCGFQHIFLLLRNILDLALWRIGLIILVLLALASGIIFYFSGQFGLADPLSQVKSLWKAAGIGYLIIFSAYTLVNIFLAIFGYKIGVFGPWWVISF